MFSFSQCFSFPADCLIFVSIKRLSVSRDDWVCFDLIYALRFFDSTLIVLSDSRFCFERERVVTVGIADVLLGQQRVDL